VVSLRYRTTFLALLLSFAVLWTAPATAAPFTATWDYGPFDPYADEQPPSPFYDCSDWGAGGLFCSWLWDQGLEVSSAVFNGPTMYGDVGPFYDAYSFDLPIKSSISSGDALLQIVPKCLPGLEPCFDTFTPRRMVADGDMEGPPGGVFFASSRGGLVRAEHGVANFGGPQWTDISWMYVGLYRPNECANPDRVQNCYNYGEQNLTLESLTFDTEHRIPEPGSVLLLGAGLLALARRHRRSA